MQTRTFHSAALRQLRYFWPQAVGGTFPQIVGHKAPLLTEAANRLRITTDRALLRDIAAEIEWAKVSMLTPDTFAARLGERALPAELTAQNMVRLFRAYEELKDERNVIDFEDILLLTVGIIEEDEALAATIRQQYRHFVVDEYQDVSPLQQRLLDAWLGERTDICVVGDASQTIYSFTGATSRHLLEFPRRYRGAQTVNLVRDTVRIRRWWSWRTGFWRPAARVGTLRSFRGHRRCGWCLSVGLGWNASGLSTPTMRLRRRGSPRTSWI